MSPLLIVAPALAFFGFLWWGAFVHERNAERSFTVPTEDRTDV